MFLRDDFGEKYVRIATKIPVNGHQPSVDVLMHSVAQSSVQGAMAIQLSGMGEDGAEGMYEIAHGGGFNIAQDESSSVVFSMPKAAIDRGVVHRVESIARIPALIRRSMRVVDEPNELDSSLCGEEGRQVDHLAAGGD